MAQSVQGLLGLSLGQAAAISAWWSGQRGKDAGRHSYSASLGAWWPHRAPRPAVVSDCCGAEVPAASPLCLCWG